LQDDSAVQYWNITEICAVQFNLDTNQIVSSVCEVPTSTPQYLSSQAATISDNMVYVFDGYMAKGRSITTKPNVS